ncbi:MAG: hypothetical protein F4X18_13560 [Acidimicrobiia bacterium]|nr:hypothetical protein [Acidimicrobiia bacterium]
MLSIPLWAPPDHHGSYRALSRSARPFASEEVLMPLAHIHFMYDLVEGDLQEAKRKLADEVADSIARNVVHHHQGSPKDLVTVVFHNIGADDWAAGGILFSDRNP